MEKYFSYRGKNFKVELYETLGRYITELSNIKTGLIFTSGVVVKKHYYGKEEEVEREEIVKKLITSYKMEKEEELKRNG